MGMIEYPIIVSEITLTEGSKLGLRDTGHGCKVGSLVMVKPCIEGVEEKTYLGIYIGEGSIGSYMSYDKDNKDLKISSMYNPAMFVPELKKVIYGCESWWKEIENEEELKQITDEDINNVWYVKALKETHKKEKVEPPPKPKAPELFQDREDFHFRRDKKEKE